MKSRRLRSLRRSLLWSGSLALAALASAPAAYAQAVSPPTVLTHVDAEYPQSALADRKHGDVTLAVTVDADGHVSKVDVLESGGADLDEAAVVAARQWTFVPAKREGTAIASRIRVPFHFAPPAPPPEVVPPVKTDEPTLPVHPAVPAPATPAPAPEPEPATPAPVAGAAGQPAEVNVTGKPNPPSRGISDFRLNRDVLTAAPHGTGADLLATAPGVFVSHPEGDAVAQRIFLRGFDADHGQDVELRVAGIPMNQPSHIHGQGYADLNLVIPEIVRSIRVVEGVYDPRQGDFAVAGSAEYDLGVEERKNRVKLSYGSFNTKRVVGIFAPEGQDEETFAAANFRTSDGFGDGTRGSTSGGAVGQYKFRLQDGVTARIHVAAYAARANIAGVLRQDDIDAGRVGFYDAYPDPSARAQSAGTSREQIGLLLEKNGEDGSKLSAGTWLYFASFRSRTNFTGYTDRSRVDPEWVGRGDLIEQANDDLGVGGTFSYRSPKITPMKWLTSQYELGSEVSTHRISQQQNLLQEPQNQTWDNRVDGDIKQSDIAAYADVNFNITKYIRLRGGARADLLFFDIDDKLGNFIPAFSEKTYIPGFRRTASGIAAGPRATLEGQPAQWLKLTASYGEGYRSPQALELEEGEQAPFSKVKSYEVGATLRDGNRYSFNLAGYQTNLSYDLAFDPGQGSLQRIGPTTRRGFVAYLTGSPLDWITLSTSLTFVHATLDSPPIATPENPSPAYTSGQSLPYVPPLLVRTDISFTHDIFKINDKPLTWKLGSGATFFSARPLPYGLSTPSVFLLDASLGVRRDWLEISVDGTNLLGLEYADTAYAFVSNWQTTAIPSRVPARHIAAGAPRSILGSLTLFL